MRVKLLCNLGTNDFPATPFRDGEEHDVTDDLGMKLVRRKLALDVTPQPAPPVVETAEQLRETPVEKPVPSVPLAKFQHHKNKEPK